MVTVLVPTGTPFSADRRSEAERHHFGHENNGGRGNVTTAESPSRLFCHQGGRVRLGSDGLWRVEVGIAGEESEQERAGFAQRSD